MADRVACVIYTKSRANDLPATEQSLVLQGYRVDAFEITQDLAGDFISGNDASLPSVLRTCLEIAEVCVLLFDENCADVFCGIGGFASDRGCRVITVGGDPDDIPTELDDISDGHVPSPEVDSFPDIIKGDPVRIKPNGEKAPPRNPDRIKCQ